MNNTPNILASTSYAIISALAFATMSVFVKLIGNHLPIAMIIFFRFAISLVLLLPWLIRDPSFKFTQRIQQPLLFFIRSLMPLLALACTFYAIKFIPLIDALLLNNTAPLFVPIVAILITGAKTPKKVIAGISIGFIGVCIILHPGRELLQSSAVIALAAGLFAAIAIVLIRVLSKTNTANQLLFYYFLSASIISGIAAIIQWQTPANKYLWLLLLLIGIFGTIYQVFATLAYIKAPVRLMSPLMFLSTIFGGFFDWWLWGNIPALITVVGMMLVIAGAVMTIYFGQKNLATSTNIRS